MKANPTDVPPGQVLITDERNYLVIRNDPRLMHSLVGASDLFRPPRYQEFAIHQFVSATLIETEQPIELVCVGHGENRIEIEVSTSTTTASDQIKAVPLHFQNARSSP